jgi:hypothetical protein
MSEFEERAKVEIAKRTRLGRRFETAEKTSVLLFWSNASNKWRVSYERIKKGETVNLDANIVMVEGTKKDAYECVDRLPPLPLYAQSFEANYRRK